MATPADSGKEIEPGRGSPRVGEKEPLIKRQRLDCRPAQIEDTKPSASKDTNEEQHSSLPPSEDDSSPSATNPAFPKGDLLTSLPLELLGEVLVNTRSTKDVLRVARCSKFLWKTLGSPSATFIWKRTRQVAIPQPMPDPPSTLSERAYALMVYSTGKCESCGAHTKEMYTSFALRLRLCKKSCVRAYPIDNKLHKLRKTIPPDSQIWERTPTIECSLCYSDGAIPEYWPDTALWCRKLEMTKVLVKYEAEDAKFMTTGNFEEFNRKNQQAIEKKKEWMKFCVALSKWKTAYKSEYSFNQQTNYQISKQIAEAKGLSLNHLLNYTTYGELYRLRNGCFKQITWDDFKALESEVKSEIEAVLEKRKRSEMAASYQTVHKAIQKCHEKFRNQNCDLIVPPFPTFRRLPMFASLLALTCTETSESVRHILQKINVEVIKAQTKKWEDDARKQMSAILGFPNFDCKSSSGEELHPVDRYSAWFLCKQCTDRAVQYRKEIKPFRFRDACMHECSIPKGERSKHRKGPWDASNFIKDEKAIAVTKKYLELSGVDETRKEPSSFDGLWIVCLSCQPYAQLRTNNIAAHSHRHEDMKIDIRREAEKGSSSKVARAAEDMMDQGADHYLFYTNGLAKKLMARTDQEKNLKDCGCRSCLLDSMHKLKEGNLEELLAKQRKMTVNGLRSHVKAKHNFEPLRDEDVFIFPPEIF